jgi:hypothetical protein
MTDLRGVEGEGGQVRRAARGDEQMRTLDDALIATLVSGDETQAVIRPLDTTDRMSLEKRDPFLAERIECDGCQIGIFARQETGCFDDRDA